MCARAALLAQRALRKERGPGFAGKPGPCDTVLRWLRAISIPNRQFGGRGGKSIETGKGGRSSAAGGLPAAAALGGGEDGGVVNGLTGRDRDRRCRRGCRRGGWQCGNGPAGAADAAGGASVRPSDAATEDAPIPGTVGSIKLAVPDAVMRWHRAGRQTDVRSRRREGVSSRPRRRRRSRTCLRQLWEQAGRYIRRHRVGAGTDRACGTRLRLRLPVRRLPAVGSA